MKTNEVKQEDSKEKKKFFNKKVIIYSLFFFLLGFIIAPQYKEVPIESVRECGECNKEGFEKKISIYEQILDIDNQALTSSAKIVELIDDASLAGFNQDYDEIVRINDILKNNKDKFNEFANKKNNLLSELDK